MGAGTPSTPICVSRSKGGPAFCSYCPLLPSWLQEGGGLEAAGCGDHGSICPGLLGCRALKWRHYPLLRVCLGLGIWTSNSPC